MTTTRRALTACALLAVLAATAGCSAAAPADDAGSGEAGSGFPVTVENCGTEVTFEQAPERIVILKPASVPALHDIGVLDRAVARAGDFPDAYFDDATITELDRIERIGGELDGTGHLQISQEAILAQQPDLVTGEVESAPRAALARLGVPLIEEPALCASGADPSPDFSSVYAQLDTYGAIFDREDAAERANSELRERVQAATERAAEAGDASPRTAAVLYPTVGGGTTYAYGTGSMAQAQLETAGFSNVFDDVSARVFEVGAEELLERDPDVLILLHSSGEPEPVAEALRRLPGAGDLTAVRNDDVMVQLLHFTEPATPLAVDGLERIIERFAP